MKTIKPLSGNIILKATLKESLIVVDESKQTARVDKVEVFKIGSDIKIVKEGEEVYVSPRIMSELMERIVDPFRPKESFDKKKEFYFVIKEEEIIGTF